MNGVAPHPAYAHAALTSDEDAAEEARTSPGPLLPGRAAQEAAEVCRTRPGVGPCCHLLLLGSFVSAVHRPKPASVDAALMTTTPAPLPWMRSIVNHFKQKCDFPLLRIGIGRPPAKMDAANFVLRPLNKKAHEETRKGN